MGEESGIEWTDSTWNPWEGCTKVSPGCQQCYAERIVTRRGGNFALIRRANEKPFHNPLEWPKLRQRTWVGYPSRRIFTCSMSDFFHPAADQWRAEAWEIIRRTPHHTYMILTKRPELIPGRLPRPCFHCGLDADVHPGLIGGPSLVDPHDFQDWPWPNVWLGTSVEMQMYLNRVGILMGIRAARRFLSIEPLLGPVDLRRGDGYMAEEPFQLAGIHWVIVGGESGPHPRKMDGDWVRLIRDQCADANVPFFFKQWGGKEKCECHGAWGCRELDGQVHDAMPKPVGKVQGVIV